MEKLGPSNSLLIAMSYYLSLLVSLERNAASKLALVLLLGVGPVLTARAEESRAEEGFMPVAVSAAHYRELSKDALRAAVNSKPALIEAAPASPAQPAEPTYYVFAPGEGDVRDMPYEEMCALLEPALARQGFHNAADRQGNLQRPMEQVPLVLRISYGTIPWRLPVVRTEQLAWRHGLRPKPQRNRVGGEVAFDYRYGGQDPSELVAQLGAGDRSPQLERALDRFANTDLYHLICIDAFYYGELQEKGDAAARVWTTFMSAPRKRGSTFAEMAPWLIKSGVAYFGRTTTGLRVNPDAQGHVELGEVEVIE